jgi:hypothetical protein
MSKADIRANEVEARRNDASTFVADDQTHGDADDSALFGDLTAVAAEKGVQPPTYSLHGVRGVQF